MPLHKPQSALIRIYARQKQLLKAEAKRSLISLFQRSHVYNSCSIVLGIEGRRGDYWFL